VQIALASAGLTPGDLVLDIGEGVLLGERPWLTAVLADLRSLGVHLHLDDFGSGLASLSALHNFALNAVKLDRTLVSNGGRAGVLSPLARGILAVAHRLDLAVVAEGVETEAQRDALREAGCTLGQGYYFAPPVDADSAAAYLAKARIVERSSP
jgi:EAL domain-containing protein (putative c-di-GMP-specific phosphodiesterase class I)